MTFDKNSFIAGVRVGMALRYSKRIPAPIIPFLTLSSANSFTLKVENATKNWDGILEWSTNETTWNEWDGTTALSSAVFDGNYKLFLRGWGNTIVTGRPNQSNLWNKVGFVLTGGGVSCFGNAEVLLDCATVLRGEHPAMGVGAFSHLFYRNSALIHAPDFMSLTVSDYAYWAAFVDCNNLTQHPKIEAINLSKYCFYYMFNGTGLTELINLNATDMPDYCYGQMYINCSSIKLSEVQTEIYNTPYRIPKSGTGTDKSHSLGGMFLYTGGTFTGTPTINTTYYTSNQIV